jgi:hypothetical protein
MWFYEYTVPHCGDEKRWDCGDCLKYKKNEARNCGNRFPKSKLAKEGYLFGPFKVFECPKTFVKRSGIEWLKFFDTIEFAKLPFASDIRTIPNKFMELFQVFREERFKIEKAISGKKQDEIKWPSMKK